MKIEAFDSMKTQDVKDHSGWVVLDGSQTEHDRALEVFPQLANYTADGDETFSLSPRTWGMIKPSIASAKQLSQHLSSIMEENGFSELRVIA